MNKPVVFISGSSRGIGRAAALCFAEKGYRLVIHGLHDSKHLKETENELKKRDTEYIALTGDIGDYLAVKEIFGTIESRFGGADILINNAGISHIGLITDMSPDEWQHIINTNLSSVFYCCREAVPYMVRKKRGKIINISSVWGNSGASCEAAYSATKGGVNSFTKALAKELAPSNIQVNAIAFGLIDTDMNHCFTEEDINAVIEDIPAGRIASAQEAGQFVYQASVYSGSYFTGQVMSFSGGWQ